MAGASLRSVESPAEAEFAQTAWIAREDLPSYQPADADTRRVLDMMGKIMRRGSRSPIHPDAERAFLTLLGLGDQVLDPTTIGDIAPRLRRPRKIDPNGVVPWPDPKAECDEICESEAEADLLNLLGEELPALRPWLIPQAPFDRLLEAQNRPSKACRRVDFLLGVPDEGRAIALEVDGSQHGKQVLSDQERDRSLDSIGIRTSRISTDDLRSNPGPFLRRFSRLAAKPASAAKPDPLLWVPLQLHRLVLALLEAVQAGFVAGDRWVVGVQDPGGMAIDLVGPYLEVLDAVDQLWGNQGVAPKEAVFIHGGRTLEYRRTDDGRYEQRAVDSAPAVDVVIRLEMDRMPLHSLPHGGDLPTIVVRTCALPVTVKDAPIGGSMRIAVRTTRGETARALRTLLRAVFAKADFRPGQLDGVLEVLQGRDSVVLLPTGAGKSLIYQLAGLCLPGRTIVIDPIVALIEDQVEGLRGHGIDRAIGITSASSKGDAGPALLRQVADANAYFTFIAPERLQMQRFRSALREHAATTPINLVVLDEAHCISEWGHDFRTSYLNIGSLVRRLCADSTGTPPPLLALTGTASRAVLRDVLFQLGIEERSPNTIVRPTTFDRPELMFRVERVSEGEAEAGLRGVLKSLPGEFGESPQTFFDPDGERTFSGLVFVPTVDGGHGLRSTAKAAAGVTGQPGLYSGRAPADQPDAQWEIEKRTYASAFKENTSPVLVTTKAFGMGIDKPNIRWVVHYGLSASIEGYYQEVGRAGRDKRRAACVLVLSEFDPRRNRQLLAEDLTLDEARKRQVAIPRSARDAVTTALYFHTKSFPGAAEETLNLMTMVDLIQPGTEAKQVEVPFGPDSGQSHRALHRLVMLGVVEDYLVEWGSNAFDVRAAGVQPADVVRHLIDFIVRTQPARADAMRAEVDRPYATLRDAVEFCGHAMNQFVYDTVERSRRRSLREMWLAASESRTGEDMRRRILDYLAEGDIAPVLERLLDRKQFHFSEWLVEWDRITTAVDAREWRSGAARLLASYPDHPGLLASRGLAEALDPDGELREFELNLAASIRAARDSYGSSEAEINQAILWMLRRLRNTDRNVLAATIGSAESAGHNSEAIDLWLKREAPHNDAALSVFILDKDLRRAVQLADVALAKLQEAST